MFSSSSSSVLAKGHARTDSAATAESQASSSRRSLISWFGRTKTFSSKTSSLPVVEKQPSDESKFRLPRWSFSFPGHGEEKLEEPREPAIVRSLSDAPEGYPSVATFLDSDENFMVYRRFGYLQARLLLDKQDDLRRLEAKVDKLDKQVSEGECPFDLSTRDLKPEDARIRRTLMDEIERRFCEYATLIHAAQQLVAANRPANFEYKSVANYMRINHPLQDAEQAWVHCKEDLITLRPGREHAWLDYGVEHVLKALNCRTIEYLFCSPETKLKGDGEGVYYTRSRINLLVIGIITLMILVLLVVPVYILYHLVNSRETRRTDGIYLGILLVFTLAFSAVLSLFTKALRHEILAAAAGYCAVLVVFLGNIGNNVTRSP